MKQTRTLIPRSLSILLVATLALLCVPGAHSQSDVPSQTLKVTLDPAQTQIRWKLNSTFHNVHGTFKLKSGQIIFNPATGVAEGEILVDATTGESGDAARDKHMQDEVLESGRYPAIFFHPTGIKGPLKDGDAVQELSSQGTFNIHGADHPLELPLKVQFAGQAVTATTSFVVPYVDWGMKNPSKTLYKVSKQVEIEVTAKGTLEHIATRR